MTTKRDLTIPRVWVGEPLWDKQWVPTDESWVYEDFDTFHMRPGNTFIAGTQPRPDKSLSEMNLTELKTCSKKDW